MKTFLWALAMIAVTFALGAPREAGAGDSVGNGDDFAGMDGVAWFTDPKRQVSYCLEIAPDFGVDRATAIRQIESAVGIWRDYVAEKKIYPGVFSFDFRRQESCTGAEDIVFFLGVTNERVRKAHLAHFSPLGLAVLETFDRKAAWGRGFVWLASSADAKETLRKHAWSDPLFLRGILLHELGHVYGCGHMSGTAMAPNLLEYVAAASSSKDGIDVRRELVPYAGRAAYAGDIEGSVSYKKLTGKNTMEVVASRVERSAWDRSKDRLSGTLFLKPKSSAELAFPFSTKKRLATFWEPASFAFKIFNPSVSSPLFSAVYYGTIKDLSGKKIAVTISLNLGIASGPFEIRTLEGGFMEDILFRAANFEALP